MRIDLVSILYYVTCLTPHFHTTNYFVEIKMWL